MIILAVIVGVFLLWQALRFAAIVLLIRLLGDPPDRFK